MKFKFFGCALLGIFFICSGLLSADARTITMADARVKFQVPNTWRITEDTGSWLVQSPDGGGVSVTFSLLSAENLEDAARECLQVVTEQIGAVKYTGELTSGVLNGMEYVDQLATAMDGRMTVSITLVMTPAKKWLMIAYLGSVQHESTWQSDVVAIAGSLQPM